MNPDQVSAELCPMGFEHFGDGDTWYLRSNRGVPVPADMWGGFVHLAPTGRWRAVRRIGTGAPAATLYFEDPIAAATWLLMEVQGG